MENTNKKAPKTNGRQKNESFEQRLLRDLVEAEEYNDTHVTVNDEYGTGHRYYGAYDYAC